MEKVSLSRGGYFLAGESIIFHLSVKVIILLVMFFMLVLSISRLVVVSILEDIHHVQFKADILNLFREQGLGTQVHSDMHALCN